MSKLIEHHTKYKEIHGVDETVWLTMSEHKKLHFRLRNEQKCNIPVDELNRISIAAHSRTNKRKKYISNYSKKYTCTKHFINTPGPNTQFYEIVRYNNKTGTVIYSACFRGHHGYKLPVIDI